MALYPNAVVGGAMSMKDLDNHLLNEAQKKADEASGTDTPSEADESATHEQPKEDSNTPKSANYEKRYRDLQSYTAKKLAEKDAKIAEMEKALQKPRLSDEELRLIETVRNENSDTYAMIKAIAMKEVDEELQATRERLEQLEAKYKHTDEDRAREAALDVIAEVHPDVRKLAKDKVFLSWVEDQTPGVRALASGSAQDAIALITMYKSAMGISEQASKSKAKALTAAPTKAVAAAEPGDGKKIWTRAEVVALQRNLAEYARVRPEIELAMREGRFQ